MFQYAWNIIYVSICMKYMCFNMHEILTILTELQDGSFRVRITLDWVQTKK